MLLPTCPLPPVPLPTLRSSDGEVFLTVCPLRAPVQRALSMPALFRQLGTSPFSVARPPKRSLEHLPISTDSLWPGRGWPGLGLPGPTPLDPSRHPHRTGTVGVKQHKSSAFRQPSISVGCFRLGAAAVTHRQHQHGPGGSGHAISTGQTGTTGRTLLGKITQSPYVIHSCIGIWDGYIFIPLLNEAFVYLKANTHRHTRAQTHVHRHRHRGRCWEGIACILPLTDWVLQAKN